MKIPLTTVQIRYERDVVLSRQRAREIAGHLKFHPQDQVRIATTISELARNVYQYAKKGKVDFFCDNENGALHATVSDQGPGIKNLKLILGGDYVSKTGMGVGLVGAKRLMDVFHIETNVGQGTSISVGKFPEKTNSLTSKAIENLVAQLGRNELEDPFQEIQRQNQELLSTMEELQKRQIELDQLNHELEDTNRGVVALYAELDEKADYLKRASEIKSRFLSNMTHEFRTPLNSILGLSRMLLDRLDGELTTDQEKQVSYIRRAATDLSELVNDLLDLSKVEAGKISIRPTEFEVKDMFGALRGMLRPLLAHNSSINLIFEDTSTIPTIFTDESKLSQVLRNFISNALKFTKEGEVRVSAVCSNAKYVTFSVADTGVGIAKDDLSRIFEEFTQIEGPHQNNVKGTGLGLSLSKRLAEVLGGNVEVKSEPGKGSTFSVTLPLAFRSETEMAYVTGMISKVDSTRVPILVLDDNAETLFIYENYLKNTRFQALPVRSIREARETLKSIQPVAIVLDILLGNENSWSFLAELKRDESTKDIPVYVVTMVENEAKALQGGADAFHLKPIERDWILSKLNKLKPKQPSKKLLLIDDDEVARYLFRGLVADTPLELIEAGGGHDGVRLALEQKPDVIFLDLDMPDLNGMGVLKKLSAAADGREIPVIFYTANVPDGHQMESFDAVVGILSKNLSSRESSRAELMELMEKAAKKRQLLRPHG